jgi:hypothetical protein
MGGAIKMVSGRRVVKALEEALPGAGLVTVMLNVEVVLET